MQDLATITLTADREVIECKFPHQLSQEKIIVIRKYYQSEKLMVLDFLEDNSTLEIIPNSDYSAEQACFNIIELMELIGMKEENTDWVSYYDTDQLSE